MNVLILNQEFPPLEGGAANACRHLARGLAASGHAVSVLTTLLPGTAAGEDDGGVRVERIALPGYRPGAFRPRDLLAFFRRARARALDIAASRPPDLLHAFFTLPGGLVADAVRRRHGIPYVVSLRGSDVPGFRLPRRHPVWLALAPLCRRVWRGAAAVAANGVALRALARRSWAGDIAVIPNGVDAARFAPPAAPPAEGPTTVLMVNQLIPRKNIEPVIRAWPAVQQAAGGPVRLRIVGRGRLEERLRDAALDAGVEGLVSFAGHRAPSDLPGEYAAADAFLLVSSAEGMSNALLEAMASGLPCLVAPTAGVEDLVESGVSGLVAASSRPDDWVGPLAGLLRDPDLRRRLGRAARDHVLRHHSWPAVAESYAALYARVLGRV